jgi:hypothetical protein
MWPWEHAALGYLLYSLGRRALGHDPPDDDVTTVLAVATVLPDLVDKPLSWGLGLFPTGYAVAHSIFLAVPLAAAALGLGRKYERLSLGVAFVVGYWSHLLGDVVNPLRTGDPLDWTRVLWPVVEAQPYETNRGLDRGLLYLREFFGAIPTMDPLGILVLVGLPLITAFVWLLDGAPGLAVPGRVLRAIRARVR